LRTILPNLNALFAVTEMIVGWVNPRVGLGWVGLILVNCRLLQGTIGCNPSNAERSETRSSGRQEVASYKALTVPASHSTPLDFWRQNAKDFPALSEVARRVLCITASSAQS